MRKLVVLLVLAALGYGYLDTGNVSLQGLLPQEGGTDSLLQTAFNQRQSDLQVEGVGVVVKVLPDDLDGSRHQRFLLQLSNGLTLLVAHNIDLAPKISGLNKGDEVAFYGEYEWNAKGGVIHWTHHDPGRRHVGGWLKHKGRTYQ